MKFRFSAVIAIIIMIFALSAATGSTALADNFNIYHVGNSLTQDLIGAPGSGFRTVAENHVEAQPGSQYSWGWHFRAGTSLTYMHDNPNDYGAAQVGQGTATVTSNVPWTTALPGYHWDAVTLQTYYPGPAPSTATLQTDTAAINGMIAAAKGRLDNANTRFYIYAPWPTVNLSNTASYDTAYLASTTNDDNQLDNVSQGYWKNLTNRVRGTSSNVSVIPVGEVFHALNQKMLTGTGANKFDDYDTILDLYRDQWHANSVGRSVAAWTAYATVFKQDLTKANLPYIYDSSAGGPATMTEHDRLLMQQTIWDVLNANNVYTNVPEPASLAAIGLGGIALLRRRRNA